MHDKKYHMAHLMDPNGNVSPLCAAKPRKINLDRELWTLRDEAVTCKKCLAKLAESKQPRRRGVVGEERGYMVRRRYQNAAPAL